MESNVKKILLIVFIALVVLFVPWWFFVVSFIWADRGKNVEEFLKEDKIFRALQRADKIYLAKSDQPTPPAKSAEVLAGDAANQAKAVRERIDGVEEAFEAPFMTADGKPAVDDRTFTEIYQQNILVENGLATLLIREGLYDPGPIAPTSLLPKTTEMNDYQRKALQKQVWIYQRLIYSLLKNASDGTRLIVKVASPDQRSGAKAGITIANCDEAAEKNKAEARIASKEPIFYGGDRIKEIEVKFAVILDERHVTEFLSELNTYNKDNSPIVGGAANGTPVAGLGDIKPITFIVEEMTVRRITPPDNPLAPEPGKVIESQSLETAQPEINALHPWVKVEVTLTVPDFNPQAAALAPPAK